MNVTAPVRLADLTTLRVGGPARALVEAASEGDLVHVVSSLDDASEPVLVVGGGSNLVVADDGFPGTVVAIRTTGVSYAAADRGAVDVRVSAGESWDTLVARTVADGLAGLESLSGIPGLAGATPLQNVGAYGGEVAQRVVAVHAYDRRARRSVDLDAAACAFGYRTSALRGTERFLVLGVTFRLERDALSAPVAYAELARALDVEVGARASTERVREAVLALRRTKGMVLDARDPDTVSAGSFFTNPVVGSETAAELPPDAPRWPAGGGRVKLSAAWLIEQSGFRKGYARGPVRISGKHTLALTNPSGGTTTDLLALAAEVQSGVRARFGVTLVPEPVLVGCSLPT